MNDRLCLQVNRKLSMLLKHLFLFCFGSFFSLPLLAQVSPTEGSRLHYRLIGFYIPGIVQAGEYKLEVAEGYYNFADSFEKNIVTTSLSKSNRIIAEVPKFGSDYTWRITGKDSKNLKTQTKLYHFSTGIAPSVASQNLRLRVIKDASKFKDAHVFLDGNRALYDMKGNPVWYLPDNKINNPSDGVRDLKLSPRGTITYMMGEDIYEINYNGDILWRGSNSGMVSKDVSEHYHHEFTRLNSGHYMVLGNEMLGCKMTDSGFHLIADNNSRNGVHDAGAQMIEFGTIIEYDEQGRIVWSWKSSNYFDQSDLIHYKPADGGPVNDIHANAFFFDEREKVIYLSFKNVSRVIKVKYPEGTVLNAYGSVYKRGGKPEGNSLFCQQHACKRSQVGCLFLFNNNGCNPGFSPKVKMLQEPLSEKEQLKMIWEYECVIDEGYAKTALSGGNVMDMPDKCLFISMGGAYSKLMIVNMEKELLWSAVSEEWKPDEKKWIANAQYRASIIPDYKKMERLIWNNKTAKKPSLSSVN